MDDDKPSLHQLGDDEFIFSAGSNLRIYNDGASTCNIVNPPVPGSSHVRHCTLSADAKLLAVVVEYVEVSEENMCAPSVYIYQIATQIASPHKPKHMTFHPEPKSIKPTWTDVYFTCCAFSSDNAMLACASNVGEMGVAIFDTILGTVLSALGTTARLRAVSFNPHDASKVCTIGENNTVAMWRLSSKTAYLSPVHGLTQNKANVNQCLAWFDDSRLLVGGSLGYILLLQGCDQIQPPTWAFGVPPGQDRAMQEGYLDSPVMSLVLRGDYVLAVSDVNCMTIFEIKRFGASGSNAPTAMLAPLKHIRFSHISRITGLVWTSRTVVQSYNVCVSSPDQLFCWDSRCDTMGSKAGILTGDVEKSSIVMHKGKMIIPLPETVMWDEAKADRNLCDFHSGAVHSLALSTRTSHFVTASSEDASVRVRDFSKPTGSSFVSTSFADRKDEVPNSIDVHPSGKYVALAGEDDALECLVADNNIEVVRRIPAKISFTLPSGAPFVNQAPVSLVRYSHAGHYIAVVTGKLAQIYHMYRYKVSGADLSTAPEVAMTMMDHTSTISDLAFSHDDVRIITTSNDGSVYEWEMGSTTGRIPQHEYYFKGTPCTKIAMNANNYIIAVYNSDASFGAGGTRRFGGTPGGAAGTPQRNSRLAAMGASAPAGLHASGSRGSIRATRRPSSFSGASSSHFGPSNVEQSSMPRGDRGGEGGAFGDTDFMDEEGKQNSYLVTWKGEIGPQPDDTIKLDTPVLSIALGVLDFHEKTEICVLGLADGRVLISLLPIPLRVINPSPSAAVTRGSLGFDLNTHSAVSTSSRHTTAQSTIAPSKEKGSDAQESYLDENQCRAMQLHRSGVTSLCCSVTGLWIFTGGADGCTYQIGTSLRARDIPEIPERSRGLENEFVITEREALSTLRTRMSEVDNLISEKVRESDRIIQKLTDQQVAKTSDLENRMKRETKKRDEIIIKTREEMIRTNKSLNAEITHIKNSQQKAISEIESEYEKKLSRESLYLDKMRQAYDEFVLHARMDMQDYEKQIDKNKAKDHAKHNDVLREEDNQKKALLAYIEYMKARNSEIIENMTNAQEEERAKLQGLLSEQKEATEGAAQSGRSEIASLTIETHKLKMEITKKDSEVMKLNGSIGWANARISKLEAALNEATTLLQKKTEVCDDWELKAGENQQTIVDLERIRKALTSQLHALRQEMMPEREKLSQVSERLQEVDREYELSLQSISEKEANLIHKGQTMNLLQNQLRELRSNQSEKARSLYRAAKILGEYKLALQEAQFHSTKRTVKGKEEPPVEGESALKRKPKAKDELVEVMTKTENMTLAMSRLSNLLDPYLLGDATYVPEEDSEVAHAERERHVMQLHKRVAGLKQNLESGEQVALNKVKVAYGDNQVLLEEVNSMRHRIKKLVQENQRQKALIDMMNIRSQSNQGSSLEQEGSAFGENPNFPSQIAENSKTSGGNAKVRNTLDTGSVPDAHLYSRNLNDDAYNNSMDSNMMSFAQYQALNSESASENPHGSPPMIQPVGGHFTYRGQPKSNKESRTLTLGKQKNDSKANSAARTAEAEVPWSASSQAVSMKSADAKIAQIMAENEAKIAKIASLRNGGGREVPPSAQDILQSYQATLSSGALAQGLPSGSKIPGTGKAPGGRNEQGGNSLPRAPGPQNKDSKAIRPTNMNLLPDI